MRESVKSGRVYRRVVFMFLSISFSACVPSSLEVDDSPDSHTKEQTEHWGYDGETAPEKWAELSPEFVKCAEGHFQSPIDIESYTTETYDGHQIQFYYHPSLVDEVNNGHTIQINLEEENYILVEDYRYELIQFHFHEPSEHRIDGIVYPMEMHMVHQDSIGKLAVVGIFIKEGPENQYLSDLWSKLPEAVDKHYHPENKCDLSHILPETREAYHYSGSLTTPPCSEGVEWYVMQKPITFSKAQIKHFRELYHGNNRPVQGE